MAGQRALKQIRIPFPNLYKKDVERPQGFSIRQARSVLDVFHERRESCQVPVMTHTESSLPGGKTSLVSSIKPKPFNTPSGVVFEMHFTKTSLSKTKTLIGQVDATAIDGACNTLHS